MLPKMSYVSKDFEVKTFKPQNCFFLYKLLKINANVVDDIHGYSDVVVFVIEYDSEVQFKC